MKTLFTPMHQLLFALVLIACSTVVEAQVWYVQARGGYAIPVVTSALGSPLEALLGDGDYFEEGDQIVDQTLFGTNGKGIAFGITPGYMFSKNFGLEFSINYTQSPRIIDAEINTPTYKAKQTSLAKGLVTTPSLVFSTGMDKKISGFSKIGLIIPVWGYFDTEVEIEDGEGRLAKILTGLDAPGFRANVTAEARTDPRPAYGFVGSAGIMYQLKSRLSIFAEAAFIMLAVRPKETKFENFNVTDSKLITPTSEIPIDIDLSENVYQTHYLYHNELTETSNNEDYNENFTTTEPQDLRSFSQNLNAMSFNLGISILLGKATPK